jgi:IS605 OrfB family transposase
MRRACKISMKFLTPGKRRRLNALLQAYRAAVNFYIRSLWDTPGRLDSENMSRLPEGKTRLSARYKSQALKQALETVVGTRRAAKALGTPAGLPIFKGSAVLDAKFIGITVDNPSKEFDIFIKISSLVKGKRITIPSKRTLVLNKWLDSPEASLIQGCSLSENSLVVWVDVPEPDYKTTGLSLGVDIGMDNLLALSDGTFLGSEFKEIRDRVASSSNGTKTKQRAIKARDNYVRQQVNALPWESLMFLAVEDLKNLKRGKAPNRSRAFRRAASPWTYRQVLQVMTQKAQENGVLLVAVPPQYTSQECPSCGTVDRRNRVAGCFKCVNCGHTQHADTVGAINILNKAIRKAGSLESPALKAS